MPQDERSEQRESGENVDFDLKSHFGLENILDEDGGPNRFEKEIIDTARALYYGFDLHADQYEEFREDALSEISSGKKELDQQGRLYWEAYVARNQADENRGLILIGLYNLFEVVCQSYNQWFFPLLVETMEIEELAQIGQHHTAVIRAGSLFEHYFREHPDLPDRDKSTAWYANRAEDTGILSKKDRKLTHFVIKLRNDAGHQTWMKTKYDYGTFSLGGIVATKLSGDLMIQEAAKVDDSVLEHDSGQNQDPQEFLDIVEQDFGWVYDEGRKKWRAIEQRSGLERWMEWRKDS